MSSASNRSSGLIRSIVVVGLALIVVSPLDAHGEALGGASFPGGPGRHIAAPIPEDGLAAAREPRLGRIHVFDHRARSAHASVAADRVVQAGPLSLASVLRPFGALGPRSARPGGCCGPRSPPRHVPS